MLFVLRNLTTTELRYASGFNVYPKNWGRNKTLAAQPGCDETISKMGRMLLPDTDRRGVTGQTGKISP